MKKIFNITIITILAVFCHFLYDWFPNTLFSFIFPVNESIWEHMKLIATPVLIFSIFNYLYYKNKNIKFNNYILSYAISIPIAIILYLIIYLPIHYCIGHNLYISIIILVFIYFIIESLSFFIRQKPNKKYQNIIGITIIIALYSAFIYLTYKPPHYNIFYDTEKNIYGIPKQD